ncbi:acyl-CoA synthetase [Gluconobacter thailandicus F149-1 = NBRC 100600]|uniref:fatty acyl-AMP ligase n=1 Tax=Gluconobacter thailandicus TaxID=257438 RepID=UPI0005E6F20B|nr:fatty acyl-AMP ligase [Gluconobacter thailandicus]GAN93664.1 acyl-CoA synthetase [Gluconobacter thailandicus F149-1 = NBRC 100600]GBR61097.1 acyl-CoA synthetase [Gluconobacter thailandicus F149-1 = NBRC 100600]GEL87038.1 acyl-CoA synthetase [Gluconobacter thailandicus F149-1 = NBRC 100600]
MSGDPNGASLGLTEDNQNPITHPAPTPSRSGLVRRYGNFPSFAAALDYAAQGESGFNIYSGRGQLLEALPYRVLREQAVSMARRLLGLGLAPGDRVAIVAESDGDFARIFFGCQYAGLVPAPLPLPVAFGGKEGYVSTLRGMIQVAAARAVVVPDVIGSWTSDIVDGLDLIFGGSPADLHRHAEASVELPEIRSEDLSYLQFSSGSTRFPMGVSVTQAAGMANARAIARDGLKVHPAEDPRDDRCVSWLPLYHDMGLVGFFLTPLTCQLTVDLLPTREFARRPHVWLDLISRNRGTIAYSPSFGYELCSRRSGQAELDLSCWRIAGIGGDMIRHHILEGFAERFASNGFDARAFVASYGMAEATLAISFAPLNTGIQTDTIDLRTLEKDGLAQPSNDPSHALRTFVLCGEPLPEHEIEVRDPSGKVQPDRHVGCVFVRGPSLMCGYFRRPEETEAVLDADGWLNTGDLGYHLNGQIVVTGRAKDLIIINGRNIWPQDLEWSAESEISTLRSRDVAVFSVETETGESIVALVQCRATEEENRNSLRDEVTSLFRRQHGVDVRVVLVPPRTLPQTSSGKLTRARAKAMLLSGQFDLEQAASSAV